MKKLLFILLTITVCFTSCKEDEDPYQQAKSLAGVYNVAYEYKKDYKSDFENGVAEIQIIYLYENMLEFRWNDISIEFHLQGNNITGWNNLDKYQLTGDYLKKFVAGYDAIRFYLWILHPEADNEYYKMMCVILKNN